MKIVRLANIFTKLNLPNLPTRYKCSTHHGNHLFNSIEHLIGWCGDTDRLRLFEKIFGINIYPKVIFMIFQ